MSSVPKPPSCITEIAYIDESYDDSVFVMSALVVASDTWLDAFKMLQDFRRDLKGLYGIFTSKELHATEFVAGRGRIAPTVIPKYIRSRIFHTLLDTLVTLPNVRIVSGAWNRAGAPLADVHTHAFSRINERLERRAKQFSGRILSIVDEGRELEMGKVARRSKVWNPVGSMFGAWGDGSSYKNTPNERLIEDPIFKPSHRSYFLQAVDFIAFALLKSEVPPAPHVARYQLHKAYDRLADICAVEASPRETRGLGIVRT